MGGEGVVSGHDYSSRWLEEEEGVMSCRPGWKPPTFPLARTASKLVLEGRMLSLRAKFMGENNECSDSVIRIAKVLDCASLNQVSPLLES